MSIFIMKLFQYLFRNNVNVQNKEFLWPTVHQHKWTLHSRYNDDYLVYIETDKHL